MKSSSFIDELDEEVVKTTLHDTIADIYVKGQRSEYRDGPHLSDYTRPLTDQCLRMLVLSHFYKDNLVFHGARLAAIFEQGQDMHKRWQAVFQRAGVARHIELKHLETYWRVFFTPDLIADIDGVLYIVELKGYKQEEYVRLVKGKAPADAINQCNLYMWDFHVWPVDYDEAMAAPYEERLQYVKPLVDYHAQTGKLPRRVCNSPNEPRAQGCRMREACFFSRVKRDVDYQV